MQEIQLCIHHHKRKLLRVALPKIRRPISLKLYYLISSLLARFPHVSPCILDGREQVRETWMQGKFNVHTENWVKFIL